MKKLIFSLILVSVFASAKASVQLVAPQTHLKTADSLAMVPYVGKYKFKDNSFLTSVVVAIEKGELVSEAEGYPKLKLAADGANADTFKTDAYEATIIFVRDDNKQVVGVKILVQGQEFLGDKEK